MANYFINSFKRKIARHFTKSYPLRVDSFDVEGVGAIDFANWENPLVEKKVILKDTIDFFRKFVAEGDFAIDIGSNIGHTTVQMAIATGKTGLTLGFDPNPFVYEVLLQNSKLNPEKTKIAIFNLAITDSNEEFYYNSSEASFNNGGISLNKENRHGKFSLNTKVKGVNLELFLQENFPGKINQLKLVKIDTEGYDKEIIKSIFKILKQHKPAVITECFGKNKAEERFEQFELLKSLG